MTPIHVLLSQPTETEPFDRHYRDVHIPMARKLPGLRSYTVTEAVSPVPREPYYRIAELCWDSMERPPRRLRLPEGRACADDTAN